MPTTIQVHTAVGEARAVGDSYVKNFDPIAIGLRISVGSS